MLYFNEFQNVSYKFGNEVDQTVFQNISIFADIIDGIKNDITFLNSFTIQEGFRPDQVSQILYNTPLHYWTFYLLNDDLSVWEKNANNKNLKRLKLTKSVGFGGISFFNYQ